LRLGQSPAHPINDYLSGEKVMLEMALPDDIRIETMIDFKDGKSSRDAGIVFRVTGPSVGYDAQRGYFVGLIPQTSLLIFGRMDGQNWKELARAAVDLDPSQSQRLAIEVEGSNFVAYHNGEKRLTVKDENFNNGRVGLRVVNTHAVFRELKIHSL
jgi:hypothetical protein